jgi:hypothetical protein
MELSPSEELTVAQELPIILWNPKVQYLVNNSPSLGPVLNQISLSHTTLSLFRKTHFNIIPPTYVFVVVSFPPVFAPKAYIHTSSPQFVLHALPITSYLT